MHKRCTNEWGVLGSHLGVNEVLGDVAFDFSTAVRALLVLLHTQTNGNTFYSRSHQKRIMLQHNRTDWGVLFHLGHRDLLRITIFNLLTLANVVECLWLYRNNTHLLTNQIRELNRAVV